MTYRDVKNLKNLRFKVGKNVSNGSSFVLLGQNCEFNVHNGARVITGKINLITASAK